MTANRLIAFVVCSLTGCSLASAADNKTPFWDFGAGLGSIVADRTHGKVVLTFESRGRWEDRTNVGFGASPDYNVGLIRQRVGIQVTPVRWLKVSAMGQDTRAPLYGPGAPVALRDGSDLQELRIELRPGAKKGWNFEGGRGMLDYGDTRLIGAPQWANNTRSYEFARVRYLKGGAKWELLFIAPVTSRANRFNTPKLTDHIFGAYNTFFKDTLDIYYLRHESPVLSTDSFGIRRVGKLPLGLKFTGEIIGQRAVTAASAGSINVSRRWKLFGRQLDVMEEYKYATTNFDQIYAANHDKFGHEDLFGWRNIKNLRTQVTYRIRPAFALNFMMDHTWLYDRTQPLYNGPARPIARSASGAAGSYVGQEFDGYFTWRTHRHFMFGAGGGRLLPGGFVRTTTPGRAPAFVYLFHTYSF